MDESQKDQKKNPLSRWRDILTSSKDTLAFVRELLLILLLISLLLHPTFINDKLSRAGFTKGNIAGFEWESAQKAQAKTGEASQQLEAATQKVNAVEKRLEEIAQQTSNTQIKSEFENLRSQLSQSLETTKKAEQDLSASLAQQRTIIQTVKPDGDVSESSPWGIVISADKNIPQAQDEVNKAKKLGYQNVKIYNRQGWLRTVVEFPNLTEAKTALPRLTSNIRNSSYLVNLSDWCSMRKDGGDGVLACSES